MFVKYFCGKTRENRRDEPGMSVNQKFMDFFLKKDMENGFVKSIVGRLKPKH